MPIPESHGTQLDAIVKAKRGTRGGTPQVRHPRPEPFLEELFETQLQLAEREAKKPSCGAIRRGQAPARGKGQTPDLQPFQIEVPFASEVTTREFNPPPAAWTLAPGLVRPKSRGRVTLASSNPADKAIIDGAFLTHPDDVKALLRGIELCREIGNSEALKPYVKREVMPGPQPAEERANFLRNAVGTYFHESCTCKMGRDDMSVVDGRLSVRGVQGLSIADASVMPTVSTGNTMAPTIIIGERMADILLGRA